MKRYFKHIIFVFLIIIIFSLTGFFSQLSINKKISNSLGIKMPADLKVEYDDFHGGFHGDGTTLAKVQIKGKKAEKIIIEIEDNWKCLPLSENLNLIMYGGEKDNVEYMYNFTELLGVSHIENGYWFFVDRHTESTDTYDDVDLFNRHSLNFTLALYDRDSNMLYYIEFDT